MAKKKIKLCKVCGDTNQANFYDSIYGKCKKCQSKYANKNNSGGHAKPWDSFDLSFDLCHSSQLREMYL